MSAESINASRVPVIATDRLTLRAHRMGDLDACRAMWADPAVVRFIGGKPSTPQQTWMRMLAYGGHWSLLHFGYWAIADRESDEFLGEIGFADFKRDLDPRLEGVPELGWALATHASGRGLATEAARAACAWGDERFERERTACLIDHGNVASLGVARKCGYASFDRTTHFGTETILLARERYASGS